MVRLTFVHFVRRNGNGTAEVAGRNVNNVDIGLIIDNCYCCWRP